MLCAGVQEERAVWAAGAGGVLPGRHLTGIPHGVHHSGNLKEIRKIVKCTLCSGYKDPSCCPREMVK